MSCKSLNLVFQDCLSSKHQVMLKQIIQILKQTCPDQRIVRTRILAKLATHKKCQTNNNCIMPFGFTVESSSVALLESIS